jgi:hypothetical protein
MTLFEVPAAVFLWMVIGAVIAGIGFGALGLFLYANRLTLDSRRRDRQ